MAARWSGDQVCCSQYLRLTSFWFLRRRCFLQRSACGILPVAGAKASNSQPCQETRRQSYASRFFHGFRCYSRPCYPCNGGFRGTLRWHRWYKVDTLTCPEGQYVALLGARAGAFLDQFTIACREIPVSGQPGPIGNSMTGGGTGGLDSDSAQCHTEQAVRSVSFKSGAYVDHLYGGSCTPRAGDGWGSGSGSIGLNIGGPAEFRVTSNARRAKRCTKFCQI